MGEGRYFYLTNVPLNQRKFLISGSKNLTGHYILCNSLLTIYNSLKSIYPEVLEATRTYLHLKYMNLKLMFTKVPLYTMIYL